MFRNFFKDESGQGMVEYGLIIALIAIVVIAVLTGLGKRVGGAFEGATDALKDAGVNEMTTPTNP